MLIIYDLETEYRSNPIGIDEICPAFSWKLKSTEKNIIQKNYHITVSKDGKPVWYTGTVETDRSLYIPYGGEALIPKTRYNLRVEVTDQKGECAAAEGFFEMGLMSYENFKADWVTHDFADDLEPCAVFVKEFFTGENVVRARVYVSALGLYEMELNGKRAAWRLQSVMVGIRVF